MSSVVLDASAVIALLRDETGSELIATYIGDAAISAVNLQEVVKALLLRGVNIEAARKMLDALHLDVRAHDVEDAYDAAKLHEATMVHGSGLGDRTCMALAIKEKCPVITTDQAWAKLDIDGLKVVLVR